MNIFVVCVFQYFIAVLVPTTQMSVITLLYEYDDIEFSHSSVNIKFKLDTRIILTKKKYILTLNTSKIC